jgi:hypothetical protein
MKDMMLLVEPLIPALHRSQAARPSRGAEDGLSARQFPNKSSALAASRTHRPDDARHSCSL